ncbi:hypothetical protein AB0F17_37610 [Nonomuraea sp. NPDC026600]|uniref:hypothetical protein n=1 Tax=Nonomuraea sp. NPDC026600 TaxID=3155363 RepID=UPI0033D091F2
MTAPEGYAPGIKVRYHGSLTDQHGEYVILDVCECGACDEADDWAAFTRMPRQPRYVLATGRGERAHLAHVRHASVTP